jgi:hypothetical protein
MKARIHLVRFVESSRGDIDFAGLVSNMDRK